MNAAHRLGWHFRALLGAVLLLLSFLGAVAPTPASASIPMSASYCAQSGNVPQGVANGCAGSKSAACTALVGNYNASGFNPDDMLPVTGALYGAAGVEQCRIVRGGPYAGSVYGDFPIYAQGEACPANSTQSGSACQCNTGYAESGGQCVPSQCASTLGQTKIINWTVGWLRSPDDDDYKFIGQPRLPNGNACEAGCTYGLGAPVAAWRSQVPNAQGLYRGSVDVEATGLGTSCTAAADGPENPQAPEPPCPGYVGEVNGKKGCYGTADKPIQPVNVPGATKPPLAGNPAAGAKPSSGEGSGNSGAGRTPSAGSGGNSGGPAGAAEGGKGGGAGGSSSGTGTTGKPAEGKEQENCGAPGQPICAVKVDEKGTPDVSGVEAKNQTAIDKLNAKADEKETGLSTVTRVPEGGTGWGFVPQWLNSQDCTPWNLGTLPIIDAPLRVDICEIQPYAVLIMTFFWVVGTIFAITGMVGRVMGSGVA
jgi:hypothetical protein